MDNYGCVELISIVLATHRKRYVVLCASVDPRLVANINLSAVQGVDSDEPTVPLLDSKLKPVMVVLVDHCSILEVKPWRS